MKTVVVLGAGMVGNAIARDLYGQYLVTSVDSDAERLIPLKTHYPIQTLQADLSDPKQIQGIVRSADLVIGALPGHMGFESLKTVIASGKNTVDISFFSEDPFDLDAAAKRKNVTAIVDCGVAPGMSNMILGYHQTSMAVESFECFVGGLPFARNWPYQYKAPFSPIDVLEEYTRPARIVVNGNVVTRPALSEPELVEFGGIGTLEAFNTDGLRTLLKTMSVPDMKEKTLRYPGHIELIRVLRETGFLDKHPVEIDGVQIRPLDLTTRLLFPKWKLGENEPEFTAMKITLRGRKNDRYTEIVYRLFDQSDLVARISSMARTTGYTCTAVARLVLEGRWNRKGIVPPEWIGAVPDCFEGVMAELKGKNIRITVEEPATG